MLYNNFVTERKNGWEKEKKCVRLFDQCNRLPDLKKTYPKLKRVYSQVLQNVAVRVDLAYQSFFRRIKTGEKPGYPRFKGFGRYDSFTFPQADDFEFNGKINLPKIGGIDWIKHRNFEGKPKTITIKRLAGKWFVYIVTDAVLKKNFVKTNDIVAIDVGIKTFATLSNGKNIDNPRFFETKQKELAKKQRRYEKLKKDKQDTKKTKRAVTKIHEKIRNLRHNFVNQLGNQLVRNYDTIIIEDINANSMIQKRWCSKQILDAAWGSFIQTLTHKAECAGRKLIKVNPAYTSQTCSKCGTRTLHELKDRTFNCSCGFSADRDANAAQNILRLGISNLSPSAHENRLGLQSLIQKVNAV